MSAPVVQPSPQRSSRSRFLFWSLFVVLVGVAAWLLFWPHAQVVPPDAPPAAPESLALGATRPVTLVFADRQARTLVNERREIAAGAALEARVEATIQALAAGPDQQDAVPALPAGTRLRQAFYDDDSATLYLDFDPTLVTRQLGGSAAEYYTLCALVRTVGANFPEVARLQILVDGQPIDTLAGHFDTSRPIDVKTWQ